MKTVLHPAGSRGHANHGWLDTHHTFSFAGYHNPERVHFGMLRVLNDDIVKGGMGFGQHPQYERNCRRSNMRFEERTRECILAARLILI